MEALHSRRRNGVARVGGTIVTAPAGLPLRHVVFATLAVLKIAVPSLCWASTPTLTPTPTKACTPGSHPAPRCAYEGPTFTQTPKVSATPTEMMRGCGNALVETGLGEECDDGGICIGGPNAGTPCIGDGACEGNGVCVGGAKAESGCVDDFACPEGRCVHCRPFGGDGCAANCTAETTIIEALVPGELDRAPSSTAPLAAGTSGAVLFGNVLTVPLPLAGTLALTVGKARSDGLLPVVVKADAVRFSGVPIGAVGCGCVRAIARKTCGGTLFDADGTPTLDCTPSLTAGDSVCAGRNACTSVLGNSNAMAGVIGCAGLDFVDYRVTQDAGGPTGNPGAPQITFSGIGGPGSAVIFGTTAISGLPSLCSGSTSDYGLDGEFCTADDPPSSVGVPTTVPFTTGTAAAEVFNANATSADSTAPFSVSGVPLHCELLSSGGAAGGTLVAATTLLGFPSLGDIALTDQIVFHPGAPFTPTPTPTPTIPVSGCVGDCNGDRAVTVDEIIRMVLILLNGDTGPSTCPGAVEWCDFSGPPIAITCVVAGVNNALLGCPAPTPEATRAPPTPTATVVCGEIEWVGGCCDFQGRRPCYNLRAGQDAAQCFQRDGGWPTGCQGSEVCNVSTGLCEP